MRKLTVFAVVVLLTLLVLSACTTPAPTQATQAPEVTPTTAQTTSQPPAAGKTELRMMMWGAPEELDVWKKIVADFESAHPDITVQVEVSEWESYWTKLKTLLAAGTPPDIFAIDAPYYLDYQTRGVLLNLQPYIDAEPNILADVYPETLKAYQTPEGYFGLPRDFQTIVVFYNKDMFDAAGVPYPTGDWTYDDFRAIAKTLTKDHDGDGVTDQYGFATDLWDMELFWSEVIWAFGGDIISPDHTKTLIGTPEARRAWQFIYDMMFVDKSMPDSTTSAQYGGDLFQAGKAAMTTIGHWAVPGYAAANLKFDVAPMPKGPAGRATSVNSAGFVIAKATKNPDAAWQFLKFVISTPAQTRLAELGFACPVLKSVAESPAFLKQQIDINQQVFLDSLAFAHMKPVFKGYDEWASVIGDGMAPIWAGEDVDLNAILDEIIPQADEVLAQYNP
jgi:multiple sugar transport system substrate-binding protein